MAAGTGTYTQGDRPGLNLESRLALTTSEVRAAADKAFENIKKAEAELQAAMVAKPPVSAVERKRLLASLHSAIANAAPNVEYAAKRMVEHTETVVETARSDIGAMVAAAQDRQVEIVGPTLSITAGTPDD